MVMKVSNRGKVAPFMVMDVLREANRREANGQHVLHLEVGQPFTPAPAKVLKAAREALLSDQIGYTDAVGLISLRQRIVKYYFEQHGIEISPNQVIVTTGSSAGFVLASLSAFDPGDKVAIPEPGYPAYKNIFSALGIEVVNFPIAQKEEYQTTQLAIERLGCKIDGLILASPANPTGTMISPENMEAIINYCTSENIRLISDEIYHGITYTMSETTALKFTDSAFIVNSFSKYYSMTGWRVGWLIVPEVMVRSVECLSQNLYISVPKLSQLAATFAFDCKEELDENVAVYAKNRSILLTSLKEMGIGKIAPADGAFYIYADIGDMTESSADFCSRLLEETGIALAPGQDFDTKNGLKCVRISYAGTTDTINIAADRIGSWVKKNY